jgi:transglutaminase/protease-like cytokinesis protein 3
MSEYELVKAIHDYVTLNTRYDDNVDEYSNSHFAEGALFNGLAVCDGYASALKMILNAAGIESLVIFGESPDGPHAWNQVKIGGEWYNVDVTWASSAGKGEVYYDYFCVPDSIFLRDHFPEKPGIAQVCTSSEYYRQL